MRKSWLFMCAAAAAAVAVSAAGEARMQPAATAAPTAVPEDMEEDIPVYAPPGPGVPLYGGDPWMELRAIQDRINRIFDDFSWRFPPGAPMMPPRAGAAFEFTPDVDVKDAEKEIVVTCDLPGMAKDKITVEYKDGNLVISGEREVVKEEGKGTGWYVHERSMGSFERVIPIDVPIKEGEIKASYVNGVLTVTLPKTEEARKPATKIQIL